VYLNKGKWKARIWIDQKEIDLGRFMFPETAAEVYDMAVIRFRGAIGAAREGTNFPLEMYLVNGTIDFITKLTETKFLLWVRGALGQYENTTPWAGLVNPHLEMKQYKDKIMKGTT